MHTPIVGNAPPQSKCGRDDVLAWHCTEGAVAAVIRRSGDCCAANAERAAERMGWTQTESASGWTPCGERGCDRSRRGLVARRQEPQPPEAGGQLGAARQRAHL
ncbi:hypothetical protein, partial [Paenibacillus xanthanilyticus]